MRNDRAPLLVATLGILAIVLASAAEPSEVQSSPSLTHRAYFPLLANAPRPPTATPTPAGCQSIPGVSYGQLNPNSAPTNLPAAQDPDLNLDIRGWIPTVSTLGLVTYNGSPDPNAPQLAGLFQNNRVPTFTSVYQVYDWNWSTNSKGPPITQWPVTLAGFGVAPGEIIQVPSSGYSIGSGYEVLVLYATNDQITLKYTRDDNVVYGYTIHVENVCVEPSLQSLYNTLNAQGRGNLPALKSEQPFGRSNGAEIEVAIRDSGSFMDPRSHNDWWQGR